MTRTLLPQSPLGEVLPVQGGDVRLSDACLRPRWGLKGAGLAALLGDDLPARPNLAVRRGDGGLIARIGATEVIGLACPAPSPLQNPPWTVPRTDMTCWIVATGGGVVPMMATLCAVDLCEAATPDLTVVQTSVATIAAIIIRDGEAWHLLADMAYGRYLVQALTQSIVKV